MRKLGIFALILVFAMLAACDTEDPESDMQEALENLQLEEGSTKDDLYLQDSVNGYTVEWASDNEEILGSDGAITRPHPDDDDATVTLTASITDNDLTVERTFEIIVEAMGEDFLDLLDAKEELEGMGLFEDPVDEDIDLPKSVGEATVDWLSGNTMVLAHDGTVTRPAYGDGDASVQLEATLSVADKSLDVAFDVTVLEITREEYAKASIEAAANDLELAEEIDDFYDLPSEIDGIGITWSSSDPYIFSRHGFYNPPLYEDGAQEIDLTATFRYEGSRMDKVYPVTILPADQAEVVKSRTLSFTSLADEYIVEDGNIETHYIREDGMPFVDVETFAALIDGAIVYEDLEFVYDEDVLEILYHAEYEDELYDDVTFEFTLDFAENTATVNRFGFFSSIAEATQTDFGEGLETIDYEVTIYDDVTMDLGAYRFDLVRENDKYLMPLNLANLFFTGSMYDIYYNGDDLYGFDTYQLMDGEIDDILNDSSKNSENMPDEIKRMTYNHLAFTFDHFYGLKEDYGIDSFYSEFYSRYSRLMDDDETHYETIHNLAFGMDDPHTSHVLHGYYEDDLDITLTWDHLGPRTTNFQEKLQEYGSRCGQQPGLTFMDDDTIAIIHLDGFDENTPDLVGDYLDEIDEKGTVEDVILDLSCNTGGIVGTAWQVLAYMTDEDIVYYNKNAGDLSTTKYVMQSETEAADYEWHILSSDITYSAGNMLVSMAKDMGAANIIGINSQGGAASITTNITPSGSVLFMSSTSLITNENFESVEMGVSVEYELAFDKFDDEDAIREAIDSFE